METSDKNLVRLFENAINDNPEKRALSDYNGISYTYRQVGEQILAVHDILRETGIKKGDKVALLGKNSARWGIIYLAVVTYGAVIVPILPDFKPADVKFIVNHSDSLVLFVEETLFKELDREGISKLRRVIRISDFSVLMTKEEDASGIVHNDNERQGSGSSRISFADPDNNDIAEISYTSGTTGFSKGVVLQHKSLLANILYAQRNISLNAGDRILSFLPMAHSFGCTFEFLFPFTLGCDITFLTKTPSPSIVLQAFSEVKPSLILTVPLLIEKIFKKQISPAVKKPGIRILLNIPIMNRIIYRKIREKLNRVFGNNFREIVIGGAALNPEVEKFFKKTGFRFTVGYGMTECGPLISYASWNRHRRGSSGRVVDELEIKIDKGEYPGNTGEIMVKGDNVMFGYYKNPEATAAVLEKDGWLHTGDLGELDKDGFVYIRGRCKSMILGPSGQNIYPEEIEALLNNQPFILESLVVGRNHKLVALLCPDYEAMDKAGVQKEQFPEIMKKYLHDVNHHLPKFMHIYDFEVMTIEFEKTPKRNIKRFLYG